MADAGAATGSRALPVGRISSLLSLGGPARPLRRAPEASPPPTPLRTLLERFRCQQEALDFRSRPHGLRAGWTYFVSFQKTVTDFAELSRHRLTMPVLAIGGARALGEALAHQMELLASDVAVVVLKGCGRWVLEQRPKETTEALLKFL